MRLSRSVHCSVWMVVVLGATSLLLLGFMQEHMELQISGLKILPSPIGPADQSVVALESSQPHEANAHQPLTTSDLLQESPTHAPGGEAAELQEPRHHLVNNICTKYQLGQTDTPVLRHHVSRVYVEERSRLLYCEVPKAGCSNWKRVLMVLGGSASSPGLIPHDEVHYANGLRRLDSFNRSARTERLGSYTKVLFVREPFERLVSAFRDKFENPNSYYHSVFGRAIISRYRANATQEALTTGAGVSFKEFVQYLLDPLRPVGMDIHWEPVSELCSPCLIKYDFIGKFERLEEEANLLLRSIGAPADLTYPHFKDRNPLSERTSATITRKYFDELSGVERQKLYDLYNLDYLMFEYTKPFDDLN